MIGLNKNQSVHNVRVICNYFLVSIVTLFRKKVKIKWKCCQKIASQKRFLYFEGLEKEWDFLSYNSLFNYMKSEFILLLSIAFSGGIMITF
ncbi:hypothetical protein HMPREF9378_1203 [Streptococcus sanguinis SK1 = NCTC 7863]|uniref:Uncharacterized protein n=2 Tax=Streptococcus sanguinis TaxID=1305 RepID=F2CEE0_STRSA|nr:hypothetical protein HMPREF9390_1208 [Streptococcus sanguinis SK405]EGF08102.1 hypothetical protein HMPREF9378_1203 [Streptococcus sanguinis SK1 = NCTC 7863]EGF18928.1 hypothetical protein HMPREF9391_1317 [Streptococcus sanguinis SK408]EGF20851.1 hypothetical protein HMPREF9395_1791 [Streptococcus sanguinis SK1058]